MSAPTVLDLSAFRAARALRDCGRNSRPREFLWAFNGVMVLRTFLPATTSRPKQSASLRHLP